MVKKGNLIIIAICSFSLLSEWSKSGQYQFAFPWVQETWSGIYEIPESMRTIRDTAARRIEANANGLPSPQPSATSTPSPIAPSPSPSPEIVEVVASTTPTAAPSPAQSCDNTATTIDLNQVAQILAANPVNVWESQKVIDLLGQPSCKPNEFTWIYRATGNAELNITIQSDKVIGIEFKPAQ